MNLPYTIKLSAQKIVLSSQTSDWCRLPYLGHPKGCPNYGRPGCPPVYKPMNEILSFDHPIYMVYSEFDLTAHIARVKARHPKWTNRQLRNVLYWQGTSRKQLKERVMNLLIEWVPQWLQLVEPESIVLRKYVKNLLIGKKFVVFYCPEAFGMNVYATAANHDFKLEPIRHLKTCHHIAIVARHQGQYLICDETEGA